MATKYKPILFSTEMVQAILEGRKKQTRRIIKPQPSLGNGTWDIRNIHEYFDENGKFISVPKLNTENHKSVKIKTGDILWVRESFAKPPIYAFGVKYIYKAGFNESICGWKPSIHMPKEAARIFLEVTNVRVEQLQDISEEDAIAEGIERVSIAPFVHRFKNYLCNNKFIGPKESFKTLWMKINGEDSWNANPWVWVYEFKVVEKPKDFIYEN